MLLACYSHKHISYRIRTIIRKAIYSCFYESTISKGSLSCTFKFYYRNKKKCDNEHYQKEK
ncbi:hypothetical protein [Wolbachia endosymbiont (group A) of Scambus nigricans]|uniref:hypothetical protein n=1 Tax=Wolbachia endosymbiont (group A) of Scambus nigricans TaxID=2954055 RepID=UPI002231AC0F|nr:hypothetical protein [Wolbachia endosymbiont (group A) of Scambus nigricans]